jgi:3,4-dihydroxy 2-butanone 4-phosphate synthase/GTP cyclohydrolase II
MDEARSLVNRLSAAAVEEHRKHTSTSTSKTTNSKRRWKPFVTLSYAQTIDGSIAPAERGRMNISCRDAFRLLHSLRSVHDAVMVGIGTLEVDNPQLNVRECLSAHAALPEHALKCPRPIVLDSKLSRLSRLRCLKISSPIVCTTVAADDPLFIAVREELLKAGRPVDLVTCRSTATGKCDIEDCLHQVYTHFGIASVLVEGGADVIQSILDNQLADSVVVTISPQYFGGYRCMKQQLREPINLDLVESFMLGSDVIIHGRPRY